MQQRRLHSRRLGPHPDTPSPLHQVLASVGHYRPAVVGAAAQDIDLVAAARAVLMDPDGAGGGMDGQALGVAVAEGEHLGRGPGNGERGSARRRTAVRPDAQHRAGVVGRVLGAVALPAVSHGHHQVPVGKERQARPETIRVTQRAVHGEDAAHRDQAVAGQLGARHRSAKTPAPPPGPLRIGEVEPPVAGKAWIQSQIQQTALPYRDDGRQSADGADAAVRPHAEQTAGAFGNQHVAAGQERHRPGTTQPGGHRDQPERMFPRSVHVVPGHLCRPAPAREQQQERQHERANRAQERNRRGRRRAKARDASVTASLDAEGSIPALSLSGRLFAMVVHGVLSTGKLGRTTPASTLRLPPAWIPP